MTTQLLTADSQAGSLPDLASLARLANELFAAKPGEELRAGGEAPSLVAHEVPQSASPPAGMLDGLDLGSPQAYTAAIPQVYPGASIVQPPGAGGAAAPSAYYFSELPAPGVSDFGLTRGSRSRAQRRPARW